MKNYDNLKADHPVDPKSSTYWLNNYFPAFSTSQDLAVQTFSRDVYVCVCPLKGYRHIQSIVVKNLLALYLFVVQNMLLLILTVISFQIINYNLKITQND
jgi:hypothetical protein